jgi:DNA-binding NtrC family response regulator
MDYLFRQHYSLKPKQSSLPSAQAPTVLLSESEAEALALYARHLTRANMLVNVCLDLGTLHRQVRELGPQLLVVNPSSNLAGTLVVLERIQATHPALPIITVGAPIPDSYLDRLMASGVALHLNRTLSQPRDLAIAARQILGLN